jgi:hypothetical protein
MDASIVSLDLPTWDRVELLIAEEQRLLREGAETRAERGALAAVRAELDALFPGPCAA